MYSKAKGIKDRDRVTPPPGYDGNRFSDRNEFNDPFFGDTAPVLTKNTFPAENNTSSVSPPEQSHQQKNAVIGKQEHGKTDNESRHSPGLSTFFGNVGKEELLLISLILILAEEKGSENNDALLLLVLLLCC